LILVGFFTFARYRSMAIALAAMMAVAGAHRRGVIGRVDEDALVAAAAQMLFVACCTAAVMFQFTRLTKSILRALDLR
jgi:hypothetical protein